MAHITRAERIKRSFLFVTLFPPRLGLLIASVATAATLANFVTLGKSLPLPLSLSFSLSPSPSLCLPLNNPLCHSGRVRCLLFN
jgi:hypothetical protein